jgi:hypothetical protein
MTEAGTSVGAGASVGDRLRAVALGLTGVEERETWHKRRSWLAGSCF